ncbi:hypothetical protein MD588_06365 [Photobacterium sp. SDRW27]|uniref:hypothetical protein n=1 Tax=Photobacterium obscurum TaxID=2829490 RepID=UPI00224364CC|nr:hypothetical protein [Photobacterium obscurum]MCW8328429.1 hypothetical protein [Photobacterium obscurum]
MSQSESITKSSKGMFTKSLVATFAVIAGASYAIVDNYYYKKKGDKYTYVESPRW